MTRGQIPFAVDRSASAGLVEQVVSGMKTAIVGGRYAVGECVPSLNALAKAFGVSLKVPRTAYARLLSEGWLTVRHGVGYSAASPDVRPWKGRILYVQYAYCFYQSALNSWMQRRLAERGYRMQSITLTDASSVSCEALELALEDKFDIVFADCPRDEYEDLMEKSGMPYVVTHGGFSIRRQPGRHCLGTILNDPKVLSDLASAVCRSGVRTIACVDFSDIHQAFAEKLRQTGAQVSVWLTPNQDGMGFEEGCRRGAERYFAQLLADRVALPDLLVFLDDYIAEGALYVLGRAGVRIPDEVKVVSLVNRGLGLTPPLDFTRLEVDARREASLISDYLVDCVEKRRPKTVPCNGPVFVQGETL